MRTMFGFRCVAAAVLLLGLSCGKPERPVAQVDGKWVGQDQWKVFCEGRGIDPATAPEASRREGLTRLLRREVGAVLAQRRGMLTDKEWEAQTAALEGAAAQKAYVGDLVRKQGLPTDAELEKAFREEAATRDLRVLACQNEENAQKARAALDGGMEFAVAMARFGERAASLPEDGLLKGLEATRLSPEVRAAVLATKPGALFGPTNAGQGFLVGRVEAVHEPSHEAFLAAAPGLRLEVRDRLESAEQEKLSQSLEGKYPLQIRGDVLKLFSEGKAVPADAEKVVATAGSEEITLGTLAAAHSAASRQAGSALPRDEELLKKLLAPLAADVRLAAEAKDLGYGKSAEAKALAWDMRQELVARLFVQRYLEELAVPDATLEEYYRKNEAGFRVPDRLHVRALLASSPAPLERAMAAVRSGAPWEQAAKTPGLLPQPQDGDLGWVSSDDLRQRLQGPLVDQIVALPAGQWAAAQVAQDRFLALQVVDAQRGGLPPFAQARDGVRNAYLRENGQRLAFEYLDGPGRDGIDVKEFLENTGPAK